MKPTILVRYLTAIVYLEDNRWLADINNAAYNFLLYGLEILPYVYEVQEDDINDEPALWVKIDAYLSSETCLREIEQLIVTTSALLVDEVVDTL